MNILSEPDSFLESLKKDRNNTLSLIDSKFNGAENVEHFVFSEDIRNASQISGIFNNFQTTFIAPKNAKAFYDNENYSNYPSYLIDSNFNYHSDRYNFTQSESNTDPVGSVATSDILGASEREAEFLNRIQEGEFDNEQELKVCIGRNYNDYKISSFKRKVPLYVGLSIIKPTETKISSIFDKHGLYESMSATIADIAFKNENITVRNEDASESTVLSVDMERVISSMYPVGNRTDKVYLTMQNKLPTNISYLDKIDLIDKINNLNFNINNYKSLINNKKAYHETLFYKVQKFEGNRRKQTYLIPPKKNVVNYTDTHVSIGRIYEYVVSCYTAVVGTRYRYEVDKDSVVNGIRKVSFRVYSSPVIKVIEMPVLKERVRVTGNGPIEPQVRFLNHSNSQNKLRIYIDTQEGEEIKKLIPLSGLDITAPYNRDAEGNVVFSSYNEKVIYRTYRMSTKPKSYRDFAGNLLSSYEVKRAPNSVVLVDNIQFNKKYYYTFRASTTFGLYSNPTPIYEVELIRDSDETKIIVNVVDTKKELFHKQRNFKQFMQIIPAIQQTILKNTSDAFHDETTAHKGPEEILTDVKIGVAEKSIWGRKFKIRVKSNDTGKTIDFNVKFKLSKIKSEDNFQ